MVFWKPNKENVPRTECSLMSNVAEKLCALSIELGFGKGFGKGEVKCYPI